MLSVLIGPEPIVMAQQYSEALPQVIQHTQPMYPPLARQTRTDGEVRVKFTTDVNSCLMPHLSLVIGCSALQRSKMDGNLSPIFQELST